MGERLDALAGNVDAQALTASSVGEGRAGGDGGTDDVPLVEAARQGDRAAFGQLYDRYARMVHSILLTRVPLPPEQVHAMPVEAPDLKAAANSYARTLQELAGAPPVLDLVHLGLGPDGHTASLVPGDPVLDITDADVALTGVYQWRCRMTLTYPIINRARRIVWVVTGSDKAEMISPISPPSTDMRHISPRAPRKWFAWAPTTVITATNIALCKAARPMRYNSLEPR